MLNFNWSAPVLGKQDVLAIQPADLDRFYAGAREEDRTNLFFLLLASLHHYLDKWEQEVAAHLSFLLAYYLFTALMPPGFGPLALHYLRQAIYLYPRESYREWLCLMEEG